MKLIPILLIAIAVLILLAAVMQVASVARYNRNRRRRKTRKVGLLTILMFPLAVVLIVAALLIPGALLWEILLFLLFGFSAMVYINSIFFSGIFRQYIEKESEDTATPAP